MNLTLPPKQIAVDIAGRSRCSVRVGACLVDRKGRIFATGWNGIGPDGMGQCAECHALGRANRKRLSGSIVYVAGFRTRTGKPVTSRPCPNCLRMLCWAGILSARYLTKEGEWEQLYV